jgi:hypothetical protein
MKGDGFSWLTLQSASLLVPSDQRGDWLEEWRTELWYVPRCRAGRFCNSPYFASLRAATSCSDRRGTC